MALPDPPPLVSVIIPVRDDAERLVLCLQALAGQTVPPEHMEVLVVDNGSRVVLSAQVAAFPHVRLLRERAPGSYAARNTGIRAARAAVLAFTDADCIPAPNWIERGLAALSAAPEAGLVAGRLDIFPRDPARPTAAERYELVAAFPQETYVREEHFGVTGNLFVPRAVMDAVGPFDARLLSGGDREWGARAHAAGFPLRYADDVRVRHPARRTLRDVRAKALRTLYGEIALRRNRGEPPPTPAALVAALLVPPIKPLLQIVRDERLPGLWPRVQVGAVYLHLRYSRVLAHLRLRLAGRG